MQDLEITIAQANLAWEDPKSNLINFNNKLEQLKNNPDLVILPEMFNTGFTMNVDKCAEDMKGPSVQWLHKKSKELNCIVAGSILIKEDSKYFNRFIWMLPDGSYEKYDKRHLFRMSNEHLTMSQGNERKIVELNGWKINLQICYDLRFPAWSRNSFENGQYEYDVLLYVSNWPEIRNGAYKSLLPARAIENQAFVIWVNRVGNDGNDIYYSGDSMVIDPKGKMLKQIKAGQEKLLNITLSAERLLNNRNKFKVRLDWDKISIVE